MTEPDPPLPPSWVHKRDGRQVTFEADKISRALFAATETQGRPDAFLARELTDGIVHFLTVEFEGVAPTTTQIAEMVVKVVRELGQPALAQIFAAGADRKGAVRGADLAEDAVHQSPGEALREVVRECVRAYSVRTVFARDVVAAQADGLLTLTGLETPEELAGCGVEGPAAGGWMEALVDARTLAGEVAAVEGLEHALETEAFGRGNVERLTRELELGQRATGLNVVVNLNIAQPPTWADELAAGPLFIEQRRSADPQRLATHGDSLLQTLVRDEPGTHDEESRHKRPPTGDEVRVDWHLSERDFEPESHDRLLRVARVAMHGAMAFVFDRPRRPVALAEGMDRKYPAVLLSVGLHLARLLDQPGVRKDPVLFLQKVGSLARFALSAGVQKRDFLRRNAAGRPALTRGFLLDRARLVVAPIGLAEAVQALAGANVNDAGGMDLARRIVERLQQVLHTDGLARRLHVRMDSPLGSWQPSTGSVGLTAWNPTATVKNQLKAAGALHAVAESGTTIVCLSSESPPTVEQIADWLQWTWQQTEIVRLRWGLASAAGRQLTLPIKGGG
jgi:hypothetical protein